MTGLCSFSWAGSERGWRLCKGPHSVRLQGVLWDAVPRWHGTFLHQGKHRVPATESGYRVHEKGRFEMHMLTSHTCRDEQPCLCNVSTQVEDTCILSSIENVCVLHWMPYSRRINFKFIAAITTAELMCQCVLYAHIYHKPYSIQQRSTTQYMIQVLL